MFAGAEASWCAGGLLGFANGAGRITAGVGMFIYPHEGERAR